MKHSYSDALLAEHPELWKKAINHPFAVALANGNLPEEAFREYVIQDTIFCHALKKMISLLVTKLPERGEEVWEKIEDKFASEVALNKEMNTLRSFRKQLNIADEEFAKANLVTKGFSDFVLSVAYQGSYKEILVALLEIIFVYEAWAEKFADSNPGDLKIQKWMDVHRDRIQGPELALIRSTLDEARKEGKHIKPNRKHKEILKYTLMWEIAFWDSLSNPNKYKWVTSTAI